MTFSAGAFCGLVAQCLLVALAAVMFLTIEAKAMSLASHAQGSPICPTGSIRIANSPGRLSGSNSRLTLSCSFLTQIDRLQEKDLGPFTLTTGAPASGSLASYSSVRKQVYPSAVITAVISAEPASLGLMGTGLLGIGMLVRHKLNSGEPNANATKREIFTTNV